jgi:hypothetical protein
LQVRVGLATGLVVVGDLIGAGAAQEQAVVGETPNLAARLQSLAEPSTVVIASSTKALTGGLFEYRDLGVVALKGFAENARAWQVLGADAFSQAIDIARRHGTKPFELRVATSFAGLLCRQRKRIEARDLLAPIYGWFTEGFDTPMLQEAKALLDELM